MNIGALINALKIALAIIPEVIEILKVVEVPGNGTEKATTVTKLIVAPFETAPAEVKGLVATDKVTAYAQKLIDIIVDFFNKVGVFKKSA